jgi:hypothetical protein
VREGRMEALQKQMLALIEMFVASQNLKFQIETASEAEVATAAKIRQQFGWHRPSDLHMVHITFRKSGSIQEGRKPLCER